MAWKEYKELFSGYGNFRRNIYGILLYTVVLGLYFPWVAGTDYVKTPALLLFYIWFPLCLMFSMMIDSFAGERDRHTLETLLASRLPDRAIVLGKILPVVIYGIGATITFIAMGLAVANIAQWDGNVQMFEPDILLLMLLLALTIYTLIATLGIVVSIKAPTVRIGGDAMVGGLIAAAAALCVMYYLVPEGWKTMVFDMYLSTARTYLDISLTVAFATICLAALYIAVRLFRRNEQMLI
jgi:ABC-2 type transport system permease protein